jgi:DNA-binding NarL/FixJ family response regulator
VKGIDPMSKIRVAICDDMEDLCQSYKCLLESYDDIEFVGMATSADECEKLVKNTDIDVLLLDICFQSGDGDADGIDIIGKLHKIKPELKIIMLTGFKNEDYVFRAFISGASDYVEKSLSVDKLIASIRSVYENNYTLSGDASKILVNKVKHISEGQNSVLFVINKLLLLSSSEFEVLKMLYYGSKYKEIAKIKFVEESTIRTLASRILKKFDYDHMKDLLKFLHSLNIFENMEK